MTIVSLLNIDCVTIPSPQKRFSMVVCAFHFSYQLFFSPLLFVYNLVYLWIFIDTIFFR